MIGIVSRSVDISPGSVMALGAVAAALAFRAGVPVELALAAGILACLAVYALNGAIVGWLGLDPLIVTLAAWIWARGLAVSLTNATTIGFDMGFVTLMNTPIFAGFTLAAPLVALAYARRLGDPAAHRRSGCGSTRSGAIRGCCARRASTTAGCGSRSCW